MQACLPSFSLQQGVNLWKQAFGNADKPFAIVTEVGVSAKKREGRAQFLYKFLP